MSAATLHERAVVADGLVVSRWGREVFESMRAGGITTASRTVAVWEGFDEGMADVAAFDRWLESRAMEEIGDVWPSTSTGREQEVRA